MTVTLHATPSSLLARLFVLGRDIKLSHSVFALPFALLGAFLAAGETHRLPGPATLGLIVLCMVLGRTVAMAINRWADASLDRLNPRTAGRAIPSGQLSSGFVLATAMCCAAAFIAATAGFWVLDGNAYPLILSPFVLAWLGVYSFTKRFTWLCHFFLGSALAISPIAAAIAIDPAYLAKPGVYWLAGMVTCWVAGFDILYALQDLHSDKKTGVLSLPAWLNVEPALWVSRILHAAAVGMLVLLCRASDVLGTSFALGVGVVAVLLVVEHVLVWRSGTRHISVAFLTLNGVVSLVLAATGILDIVAAV